MKSNLMYFYLQDIYRINEIDLNDFVKETDSTYRKNYSKITFIPMPKHSGMLIGKLTIAKLGEPHKEPIMVIASKSIDKLNKYADEKISDKYAYGLQLIDEEADSDYDRLNNSFETPIRVDGF